MSKQVYAKLREASVYVHIFADGRFVFQRNKEASLHTISIAALREELEAVGNQRGVLYYSLEELESPNTAAFEKTLDTLFAADVDSQMVHPRAEVYDYHKTFAPYLSDALEAAALDVQGILEQLAAEKEANNTLQKGSIPFLESVVRIRKLEHRYIQANMFLEQISFLHSELCLEYDDLEN